MQSTSSPLCQWLKNVESKRRKQVLHEMTKTLLELKLDEKGIKTAFKQLSSSCKIYLERCDNKGDKRNRKKLKRKRISMPFDRPKEKVQPTNYNPSTSITSGSSRIESDGKSLERLEEEKLQRAIYDSFTGSSISSKRKSDFESLEGGLEIGIHDLSTGSSSSSKKKSCPISHKRLKEKSISKIDNSCSSSRSKGDVISLESQEEIIHSSSDSSSFSKRTSDDASTHRLKRTHKRKIDVPSSSSKQKRDDSSIYMPHLPQVIPSTPIKDVVCRNELILNQNSKEAVEVGCTSSVSTVIKIDSDDYEVSSTRNTSDNDINDKTVLNVDLKEISAVNLGNNAKSSKCKESTSKHVPGQSDNLLKCASIQLLSNSFADESVLNSYQGIDESKTFVTSIGPVCERPMSHLPTVTSLFDPVESGEVRRKETERPFGTIKVSIFDPVESVEVRRKETERPFGTIKVKDPASLGIKLSREFMPENALKLDKTDIAKQNTGTSSSLDNTPTNQPNNVTYNVNTPTNSGPCNVTVGNNNISIYLQMMGLSDIIEHQLGSNDTLIKFANHCSSDSSTNLNVNELSSANPSDNFSQAGGGMARTVYVNMNRTNPKVTIASSDGSNQNVATTFNSSNPNNSTEQSQNTPVEQVLGYMHKNTHLTYSKQKTHNALKPSNTVQSLSKLEVSTQSKTLIPLQEAPQSQNDCIQISNLDHTYPAKIAHNFINALTPFSTSTTSKQASQTQNETIPSTTDHHQTPQSSLETSSRPNKVSSVGTMLQHKIDSTSDLDRSSSVATNQIDFSNVRSTNTPGQSFAPSNTNKKSQSSMLNSIPPHIKTQYSTKYDQQPPEKVFAPVSKVLSSNTNYELNKNMNSILKVSQPNFPVGSTSSSNLSKDKSNSNSCDSTGNITTCQNNLTSQSFPSISRNPTHLPTSIASYSPTPTNDMNPQRMWIPQRMWNMNPQITFSSKKSQNSNKTGQSSLLKVLPPPSSSSIQVHSANTNSKLVNPVKINLTQKTSKSNCVIDDPKSVSHINASSKPSSSITTEKTAEIYNSPNSHVDTSTVDPASLLKSDHAPTTTSAIENSNMILLDELDLAKIQKMYEEVYGCVLEHACKEEMMKKLKSSSVFDLSKYDKIIKHYKHSINVRSPSFVSLLIMILKKFESNQIDKRMTFMIVYVKILEHFMNTNKLENVQNHITSLLESYKVDMEKTDASFLRDILYVIKLPNEVFEIAIGIAAQNLNSPIQNLYNLNHYNLDKYSDYIQSCIQRLALSEFVNKCSEFFALQHDLAKQKICLASGPSTKKTVEPSCNNSPKEVTLTSTKKPVEQSCNNPPKELTSASTKKPVEPSCNNSPKEITLASGPSTNKPEEPSCNNSLIEINNSTTKPQKPRRGIQLIDALPIKMKNPANVEQSKTIVVAKTSQSNIKFVQTNTVQNIKRQFIQSNPSLVAQCLKRRIHINYQPTGNIRSSSAHNQSATLNRELLPIKELNNANSITTVTKQVDTSDLCPIIVDVMSLQGKDNSFGFNAAEDLNEPSEPQTTNICAGYLNESELNEPQVTKEILQTSANLDEPQAANVVLPKSANLDKPEAANVILQKSANLNEPHVKNLIIRKSANLNERQVENVIIRKPVNQTKPQATNMVLLGEEYAGPWQDKSLIDKAFDNTATVSPSVLNSTLKYILPKPVEHPNLRIDNIATASPSVINSMLEHILPKPVENPTLRTTGDRQKIDKLFDKIETASPSVVNTTLEHTLPKQVENPTLRTTGDRQNMIATSPNKEKFQPIIYRSKKIQQQIHTIKEDIRNTLDQRYASVPALSANLSSSCRRPECTREASVQCSVCKTARYCDENCQRVDWSVHRNDCRPYSGSVF